MTPASAEFLRNTVVGLVTSVVLIIVGYKLNDWMSRDRLSIEYVQFKPQTQGLPPKSEIAGELLRNSEFTQWTGSSPFSPCATALGDQVTRTWNAPLVKQIDLCLHSFIGHIDSAVPNLEQSRTSAQSTRDLGELVASVQPDLTADAISNISHAAIDSDKRATLLREINSAVAIDTEAKKLAKQILDYVSTYKAERTGELEIWVTVLNRGDTDGLIRPEASLSLNDANIAPLRVRLAPGNEIFGTAGLGVTNTAKSIPKRSSATLVFRLIPQELDRSTSSYVVKDIKQKPDLSGTVELHDIRNSVLNSKQFAFPADDNDQDGSSN